MNSGLKSVYKYLSDIYFYEKKHWNHTCARLFSIIAAPFANLFYKGMRLISTYPNSRFKSTITKSLEVLKDDQNLIIFPEDSRKGYYDKLSNFFAGFVVLGNVCLKRGEDLPVYLAYYKKKKKTFVIDKPIMFSELVKGATDRQQIADKMCERINSLREVDIENLNK